MYDGGNYAAPSKEVHLPLMYANNKNYLLNVGGSSQDLKLQDLKASNKKRNEAWMYDGGNYKVKLQDLKASTKNHNESRMYDGRNYQPHQRK